MNREISQYAYPPNSGEHDTSGLDCWCSPRYLLPCDECSKEDVSAERGCWKCKDGAIELSRSEAEATAKAIVIVHNR